MLYGSNILGGTVIGGIRSAVDVTLAPVAGGIGDVSIDTAPINQGQAPAEFPDLSWQPMMPAWLAESYRTSVIANGVAA